MVKRRNYPKTERVLRLVRRMSGRSITKKQYFKEFGESVRNFNRDLGDIRAAGYNVHTYEVEGGPALEHVIVPKVRL